jgi:hypothetical protein
MRIAVIAGAIVCFMLRAKHPLRLHLSPSRWWLLRCSSAAKIPATRRANFNFGWSRSICYSRWRQATIIVSRLGDEGQHRVACDEARLVAAEIRYKARARYPARTGTGPWLGGIRFVCSTRGWKPSLSSMVMAGNSPPRGVRFLPLKSHWMSPSMTGSAQTAEPSETSPGRRRRCRRSASRTWRDCSSTQDNARIAQAVQECQSADNPRPRKVPHASAVPDRVALVREERRT